jgi:hypothetical protein
MRDIAALKAVAALATRIPRSRLRCADAVGALGDSVSKISA